ncbi:hypothetical protein BGP78_06515 [Pseudoalteromonas sp. MSK9-3]|uniref:hypothetical protein n=1 Tax=Pseudoalteromonas sp. MSK9-3 TaxID=1897633 RepID=UPI000E6D2A75|nr:hypothetical protein [Pseudoalteromonas sp. MSK9-3]RJE78158.1 hypothetical protein BGP78_06515 [Pseudoalteromonas sp. MSK9-3]
MSTIESQIQKLNDTNAELARVNNELTSAVRTHTNDINNEVAAAKNTMAAATASAITEVKADANAVNDEIKARMDDAVVPWLPAMTKVQFDALRADRKQQYAGSGFVEWGKHYRRTGYPSAPINSGLFSVTTVGYENTLSLGSNNDVYFGGDSKSRSAKVILDGIHLKLNQKINNSYGSAILIQMPQAPDGTKTYDTATGSVTKHTNAEVAFAAETATNKVITSRKDLVFLESWHEKIADKDVVYPLGNVQYGASSYEGVTLSNNLVAQGYSAFGEWDENTKGYGAKWSSLTDAQKARFLSEPEHNIYYDAEAKMYIQVRYRIRVIEGFGDDWVESITPTNNNYFRYNKYHQSGYVSPQGVGTIAKDFNLSYPVFTSANRVDAALKHDDYLYGAAVSGNKPAEVIAYEGLCFALPIALVQRMNQGAYHPVYNPMGTRRWNTTGVWANYEWYHPRVLAATNTAACFQITMGNPANNDDNGAFINSGYINSSHASGRPDQYKFYDAIYAGQVEDLRLNANKLDVDKLREDTMRKAVEGTLRGKGKVSFTRVGTGVVEEYTDLGDGYSRVYLNHVSGIDARTELGTTTNRTPQYNVYIKSETTGFVTKEAVYVNFAGAAAYIYFANPYANDFATGDSVRIVDSEGSLSPEFDSLPWVDIIGDPERIAATFPDGVVGQWVPQLPSDETDQLFKANRKYLSHPAVNALRTMDNGETWQAITSAVNEKNQVKDTWNTQSVGLVHYESPSHFTNLADNGQIVGTTGNVYQGNFHHIDRGNRLNSSVSGVIAKQGSTHKGVGFLSTNSFTYESWSIAPRKLTMAAQPEHQPVDLASGNESGGMKALPTITEKNGLYYLQFHGAELKHHKPTFTDVDPNANTNYIEGDFYCLTNYGAKGYYVCEVTKKFAFYSDTDYIQMESGDVVYGPTNQVVLRKLNTADGSSWGDDQTIPIVNGEDVKTDLNGNTVKVFCHHSQIPLGIAHND